MSILSMPTLVAMAVDVVVGLLLGLGLYWLQARGGTPTRTRRPPRLVLALLLGLAVAIAIHPGGLVVTVLDASARDGLGVVPVLARATPMTVSATFPGSNTMVGSIIFGPVVLGTITLAALLVASIGLSRQAASLVRGHSDDAAAAADHDHDHDHDRTGGPPRASTTHSGVSNEWGAAPGESGAGSITFVPIGSDPADAENEAKAAAPTSGRSGDRSDVALDDRATGGASTGADVAPDDEVADRIPPERLPPCPNCGGVLAQELITEHRPRDAPVVYDGFWCTRCDTGFQQCPTCDQLHRPTATCPVAALRDSAD